MSDWNASLYSKFLNERTQPAIDLISRAGMESPRKIIDIGCGPGNSTGILAQKFSDSYILGIDSSQNMIETAKASYPSLDFKLCDIKTDLSLLDKDFDIVFSNACIQWVPNHELLLPELLSLLKKGGILAIQIPYNFNEPIHKIIIEAASSEEWKGYFPDKRVNPNLTPNEYYDILSGSCSEVVIWETVYYHVMESHQAILEWYRSTGLRPYLDVLPKEKVSLFENDFLQRVKEKYPQQKNGKVLFRFPRLFMTARA